MRTGSEPVTARSPLRMRFWLSLWGALWVLFGLVAFSLAGRPGWAAACAVVLLVAIVDLCVITRRIRRRPGPGAPPGEREHGGRAGHGGGGMPGPSGRP